MKFVAFIMASLVLALSVWPCADEGFFMETGKVKAEITKQHNHAGEQEHKDACSPFCHCTCCAGFSISPLFAAAGSQLLINGKSYISYLPGNLIEYSSPIWQPPQLPL